MFRLMLRSDLLGAATGQAGPELPRCREFYQVLLWRRRSGHPDDGAVKAPPPTCWHGDGLRVRFCCTPAAASSPFMYGGLTGDELIDGRAGPRAQPARQTRARHFARKTYGKG